MPVPVTPIVERFWAKVNKTPTCWLWTGAPTPFGYGKLSEGRKGGKQYRAHRFSWELHRGPVPPGLWVLHACDVRLCVNPEHLFLGTAEDNVADMLAKGRNKSVSGERHGRHKLSALQVRQVRWLLVKGFSQQRIAQFFGVVQQTVSRIKTEVGWQQVDVLRDNRMVDRAGADEAFIG